MAAKSTKGTKRPAQPGGTPGKPAAVDEREVVRFVETVAERAAAELARRARRRGDGPEPGRPEPGRPEPGRPEPGG